MPGFWLGSGSIEMGGMGFSSVSYFELGESKKASKKNVSDQGHLQEMPSVMANYQLGRFSNQFLRESQ